MNAVWPEDGLRQEIKDLEAQLIPLGKRIDELEAENKALAAELAALKDKAQMFRDYADSADRQCVSQVDELAALKDENERLTQEHGYAERWFEGQKKQFDRAEQAESELAALKARRCETCKHWRPFGSGAVVCGGLGPDTPIGSCRKGHVINVSEVEGEPAPAPDFACSEWEAREDGES
jgi:regulator of replication initiation timing